MRTIGRAIRAGRAAGRGARRWLALSAAVGALWLLLPGAEFLPAAEKEVDLGSLLEDQPRIRYEDLDRRFRGLKDASVEELENELVRMESQKEVARENWERMRSIRPARTAAAAAAELRAATMTISLWQAEHKRKRMLAELYSREREAYEREFGPIHYGRDGIMPKNRKNWKATAEYPRFRQAEVEIGEWFLEETARIAREARAGAKEEEGALDRASDEIVREYSCASDAVRWLKEAIKRKKLGGRWVEWKEAEEEPNDEEDERRSGLRLVPVATHFDLETGKPEGVWFNVYSGAPPYYLMVNEAEHGTRDIAIEKPGLIMLPFCFDRPGAYIARAAVYDDRGGHRELTLTFDVAGGEITPGEGKKDDAATGRAREETVEDDGKDLLAAGIWPDEPLQIPVGHPQKFQLLGVYAENVFDAVDVSYKTRWQASPGLELVEPGTYLARQPGTYTITGSVKKGDAWMTATAVIEVTNTL